MNPLLKPFSALDRLPHTFQIIGVAVAGMSAFLLCYGLSANGLLEIAATALSYFVLQLLALMGPRFSKYASKDFPETANFIDTALSEFAEWRNNRRLAAKGLLALLATALFMLFRFLAVNTLPLIASWWFAGAIGLAVTACVISPVLVRGVIDTFRTSTPTTKDTTDD